MQKPLVAQGVPGSAWKQSRMPGLNRAKRPALEWMLLKRSLTLLQADRSHCVDCGRTPLTGERVFFFGQRMVCELCKPLRRREPDRADRVHSSEHGLTVRRLSNR